MSALLDSLNASKIAYYNLKENLQSSVDKLTTSKNFLEVPAENIIEFFQIDGLSADGKDIEIQKSKVENHIKNINDTIIPAIDSEINDINKKIAQEEARIEEERRQEEERKAQEAEEEERKRQLKEKNNLRSKK